MSTQYFERVSHVVPCQHIRGYYRSTANSQEDVLHISVRQYIPLDNPEPRDDDVTIIACHAAGFFKEMYEPFFDDLYVALKACNVRIRGIWIADTASHGESSILNEGKLGNDPCWNDHARDLLQVINTFRAEMRLPIVGIGHSMGGTNIVQLALLHPRLFTSIVCIEPIINSRHKGMNFASTYGLSARKDVWASREQAIAELGRGPMTKTWDSRVKELNNEHGLRDLPTLLYPEMPDSTTITTTQGSTPVTLATTRHHNVTSFARAAFPDPGQELDSFSPDPRVHIDLTKDDRADMQAPVYRPEAVLTFHQLPFLRPSCFYMYGKASPFSSATPQARAEKLQTTGTAAGGSGGFVAGRVQETVLDDVGHFMVFEKPTEVAVQASQWLKTTLEQWKRENQMNVQEWEGIASRERAMVDDKWMYWVKKQYGRPSTKSKKPVKGKL